MDDLSKLILDIARAGHAPYRAPSVLLAVSGQLVKVRTEFVNPPIPDRNSDWSAVTYDYEPGSPIGRGRTELAAIEDLKWQLEELYEDDKSERDDALDEVEL